MENNFGEEGNTETIKFRYVFEDKKSKKKFLRYWTIRQIETGSLKEFDFLRWKLITRDMFTGLHDKNGKEIYEGDVVFSESWNPPKQEVTFDRGGFCLKYDNSEYYPDIKYAEQMEIIGNIHENPEVIK